MAEQTDKKTEQETKETKPVYKQWWFYVMLFILGASLGTSGYYYYVDQSKPEQSFAYYF
jgi:hypothetical protein